MSHDDDERRVHARVKVTAEVRISGPHGVVYGELRDLSKGGAGVFVSQSVGNIGEIVELFLPLHGGIEIAVMAEILRSSHSQKGFSLGLRFTLVEPAMQGKLMDVIESLLEAKGSPTRRHPRVAKRLPVRYGQLNELKAMLENISLGGLQMTVASPLVLYEEVEVAVPDLARKDLLILTGRVLYQHPAQEKGKQIYRVGLQFKELSEPAKRCLQELLRCILEITTKKKA